jgi:peptidoglycan/xylan/chitin deacetylase (PgdA/CDA1 family)
MAQAIFPPQLPPLPPSKRIALKVDVETYRGTTEGVPRLIEVFRRHGAGATFLFTFGAPRTGAALLRAGTRAVRKLGGHSLLAHYGVRALLHGTVLLAPDIGWRCADVMRRVRDEGFEVGIHAWDSARWRRGASAADAAWTARQMKRAADRFHEIFGQPARVHGAAGWQMNVHAYRQTQRLGFDYCSDTRGTHPFIPVVNAELIACPQVPTTLPGLMQLLARDGMDAQRAADELLAAARASNAPAGHVYTLHADFEGRKLLPLFEQVLSAWRAAGIALIALGDYLQAHGGELPRHSVHAGPADGILGRVALQGPEFLG